MSDFWRRPTKYKFEAAGTEHVTAITSSKRGVAI
jgi:hypothetical protein